MTFRIFSTLLLIATWVPWLAACGGGGGGGDGVQTGVFRDAAVVEGLRYQTASLSGITDANGRFRFRSGEQVTFAVGDLVLGQAAGASQVNTFDLAGIQPPSNEVPVGTPTATGRGLDKALNISLFLQSIDEDSDLANRITVPVQLRSMQARAPIRFETSAIDFKTHPTLGTYMGQARAAGIWGGSRPIKNPGFAATDLYRGLGLTVDLAAVSEVVNTELPANLKTTTRMRYSDRGLLVEERYLDNSDNLISLATFHYDQAGNLIRRNESQDGITVAAVISHTYDANGYLIKSEATDGASVVYWTETISRDIRGNMLERIYIFNGNQVERIVQRFDDLGRLTRRESLDTGGLVQDATEYEYDEKYQLARSRQFDAAGALTGQLGWEYDALGGLTKFALYDPAGQLLAGSAWEYTVDASGTRTRAREFILSAQGGRRLASETTNNARGQPEFSRLYDSNGDMYNTYEYTYDSSGRRIRDVSTAVASGASRVSTTQHVQVPGWRALLGGS